MNSIYGVLTGGLALALWTSTIAFAKEDCGIDMRLGSSTPDSIARLVAEELKNQQVALKVLRDELPIAFPEGGPSGKGAAGTYANIKDKPFYKLLDRLLIRPDVELSDVVTIAFAGPARMGKSTIINSIRELANGREKVGNHELMTPSGRGGGTTKRPLIVIPNGHGELHDRRRREIKARYPDMQPMRDPSELLQDGPPLFTVIDGLENFPNLVFIDTPDMTTGDQRQHAEPVHLQKARDAILAADVLVFMLDDDNVKDLRLGEIISEGFKLHGFRNSAFILRTDAETEVEFRNSRDWLIDATRKFYGLEGVEGPMPKAVKAIFAVARDPNVKNRLALPTLVPLDKQMNFPTLLTNLAENSAEHRGHAAREAAKAIYKEVEDILEDAFSTRHASEIYQIALDSLLELPPPFTELPLNKRSAAAWRKQMSQHRNVIHAATEEAAQYTSAPGAFVAESFQKRRLKEEPEDVLSFAEMVRAADAQVRTAWSGHLAKIIRELHQGRVTLRAVAANRLYEKIEAFNRESPTTQFALSKQVDEDSELVTVELPPLSRLNAKAQKAMNRLFDMSQETIMGHFVEIEGQEKLVALTEAKIDKELKEFYDNKYTSKSKRRDFVSSFFTNIFGAGGPTWGLGAMVAPKVLAAFVASSFVVPVGLLSIGVGIGGAAVIRLVLEGKIDAELKPILQDWWIRLQADTFKAKFGPQLLEPVKATLDSDAPSARMVALGKVRAALKQLKAIPIRASN